MTERLPEFPGEKKSQDWKERIPKVLFEGGSVMATPAALGALKDAELEPMDLLSRHLVGDWGDVSQEEKMLNNEAVKHGEEILSAYQLPTGLEIWVITEANREATKLRLSDEESD